MPDKVFTNNQVVISGEVVSEFVFSHEVYGEGFYILELSVPRLSDAYDVIPLNVHYKPLPMLSAYRKLGFKPEDYPNAMEVYQNEVTLPLHTKLTDEQVSYIISNFKEIYV